MSYTCIVNGCDKPSQRKRRKDLCQMHYTRLWRTGSLLTEPNIFNPLESGKYQIACGERVHRLVYLQTHPDKPEPCWNCGKELSWSMGKRLHIDHIDGDTTNNHISNLRASCIGCNTTRPQWDDMESTVDELRWLYGLGVRQAVLAREYSLSPTVVNNIVHGRSYSAR